MVDDSPRQFQELGTGYDPVLGPGGARPTTRWNDVKMLHPSGVLSLGRVFTRGWRNIQDCGIIRPISSRAVNIRRLGPRLVCADTNWFASRPSILLQWIRSADGQGRKAYSRGIGHPIGVVFEAAANQLPGRMRIFHWPSSSDGTARWDTSSESTLYHGPIIQGPSTSFRRNLGESEFAKPRANSGLEIVVSCMWYRQPP